MKDKVSVVIPAYNAANTLARALESVLVQTLPPHEIIVVDDGSIDTTRQIIEPYLGRVLYVFQENAGASAARNKGSSLATGEFLAFLDSDDVWHPAKLELQVSALRQHPQVGMCWSDPKIIPESDASKISDWIEGSCLESKAAYEALFDDVFRSPFLGTPNVLIRRNVFEKSNGFDTSFVTAEDLDLWMRVAYVHHAIHLPQVLCFVLRQQHSLSTRYSDQLFSDHLAAIEKFCRFYPDFANSRQALVKEARAKVYEHWGSALLAGSQPRHAVKVLGRALLLHVSTRSCYLFVKAVALSLLVRDNMTH